MSRCPRERCLRKIKPKGQHATGYTETKKKRIKVNGQAGSIYLNHISVKRICATDMGGCRAANLVMGGRSCHLAAHAGFGAWQVCLKFRVVSLRPMHLIYLVKWDRVRGTAGFATLPPPALLDSAGSSGGSTHILLPWNRVHLCYFNVQPFSFLYIYIHKKKPQTLKKVTATALIK